MLKEPRSSPTTSDDAAGDSTPELTFGHPTIATFYAWAAASGVADGALRAIALAGNPKAAIALGGITHFLTRDLAKKQFQSWTVAVPALEPLLLLSDELMEDESRAPKLPQVDPAERVDRAFRGYLQDSQLAALCAARLPPKREEKWAWIEALRCWVVAIAVRYQDNGNQGDRHVDTFARHLRKALDDPSSDAILNWFIAIERSAALALAALAAKAAGGGPVQFEVLSGPAEIRDGALVVTNVLHPQSVMVRAVQPGGAFDFPGETVRVFNRVEAEFEELGTLSTSGQVQAVALTNGFAFIAESTEGVVTVDVRDPAQPRRMSAVRLGTTANALVVSDGRAVVVEQSGHLTVVDGRDPANPRVVGTLSLGVPLSQVVVRGTTAFLSSPEGIRIVDLTQPSNPRLVGGLKRSDLGAVPLFLIERAGFLYMSHSGAGFSIVDVRDRERPALMGTLAERVSTGGFAFVGDWLWARRDPLGLCALDVSVPSAPRIRSLQPIPEVSWTFGYGSMPVAENMIISDASKGLIAVEILGPDQTLVAGSYVSRRNWDLVRGMSLDGELLGVANSRGGLRLLRLRRGIRTSLTGLALPTVAEKGQAIALSPTFNGHIPLEYTVVSGPARIVGGQLHLDDVGQVEIGAAVAPSGRFLPVQIRHVLRVDPLLLDAIRGAADDELILNWRVDTDVLETAEQVGGPWSPVPGARPPFRIPDLGTRGYYRVIRNP